MTFRKFNLLLLILLLTISVHGQMTTATLSPTEDTYVESGSTANNSAGTSLFADITSTSIRRSYLKFDIASLNIPSNAVVYSAYLKLPIQTEYVSPVTISVQRATAAWTASTITYASQPALETSDASTTSDVSSGYRRVLVTAQVQKMANMPALDKGFCVHRYNETGSARLYEYHSNENTGTKPVLEINYYVPFYANNSTTIQHASSAVATDAVISPQISGGQGGTISYQWYNSFGSAISGATNLTLSGVGYGWYGLRISSTIGDPVYVAFLVGVNCGEVNIDFEPGPLYINDAMLYERNDGTINYGDLNYGTNARIRADNNALPDWYSQRSLIQFNLWVDPALNVLQSDLTLAYESHNITRPNTSEILVVTEPWLESTVTHNMGIATTSTDRIELPSVAGGGENGIIDLKNYWDFWKQDNTQNFGLLMQLTLYDNATACRRSYHSSDATDTTKLPYVTFRVSLPVVVTTPITYNYFDALGTGWGYTIGTPSYTGTGSTGTDVTGVKVIDGNKVMAKSYSTGNSTGQRASTNTITFSNISSLGDYDIVDFDFELGSLGTATTDAGVDTGEDFNLEVSTDNGSTWVSILTAAGGSNLLFPLATTPVTALNIQSTHAWTSGESHYTLRLEGTTQFQFRFTAKNNRTNENWVLDNITLTGVQLPLSSAWDDEAGTGSITFSYENACGAIGPYHYMISESGIMPMKNTYKYLKDSIFGGVLDSAAYFQGNESLLTYTFTDLPVGNYHIGVFDSRGELVFAGEKAVHPLLMLSSYENMEAFGTKFISTDDDSRGIVEIYADETTGGGMEIQLNDIEDEQSFGFIPTDRAIPSLITPTITDQVGISVSGGEITRTASGSSWGNSGGASVETIKESGYIEWTLGGTTSDNRNVMVGLSYTNADAHYNTIDYAWYTYTSGINVYIDGNLPSGHVNGQYPGLTMGDVLKIERKDNNILFYQNSVLLYTAADSYPSTPMIVDFALSATGRKIHDLKVRTSTNYETVTAFIDYSQFENGFHLIDEKVYTVKNGVLSVGYETATANSRLQILLSEGEISYLLDGEVIDTDIPPGSFEFEVAAKRSKKGIFNLIPIRLNLWALHLFTNTVEHGDCENNAGSFTFDVIPYFYPSLSYDFVVKDQTNVTVSSGTHTTSTFVSPNPYTVNLTEPGIYTLTLTSSSLPDLTINKILYVGVETDWVVNEKYTLTPNTYSLERDATSANAFSKAMSRNMLNENETGWIRFNPVAQNFLNPANNYFTFSSEPYVTEVPVAGEAFLSFRKTIAMASLPGGIITPAGIRMTWKNASGTTGSSLIANNSQITVLISATSTGPSSIIIKVNDVVITTLNGPSGIIRMKANSNKQLEGFDNVVSSFGCHLDQSLSTLSFYKLKDNFDGGHAYGAEGKVKIYFSEEYKIEDDKYLPISIYDASHAFQGAVDLDGNVTGASGMPLLEYHYDDNRHVLDLSALSLTNNQFYILEVKTSTGERKYLKFLFKN